MTRDSIRDLAGGILRSHFGEKYERRYLAWRSFQNEDDRPLILLLGGTSGVGKSSLAVEVARRLSIGRVLSTDSIRDVIAFPKTTSAQCLLTSAPSPVPDEQVAELHIRNIRKDS